jgi:PAS domain S-box-containing protein
MQVFGRIFSDESSLLNNIYGRKMEKELVPLFDWKEKDYIDQIELQYKVTKILSESESFQNALSLILPEISEYLGCTTSSYWVLDGDGNILKCDKFWHNGIKNVDGFENLTQKMTFPSGVGLPGRAVSTKDVVWLEDIASDHGNARAEMANVANIHGGLFFPVIHKERILGVLEFFKCDSKKPEENKIQLIKGICTQISQFVIHKEAESEQKRLMALIDSSNDSVIIMSMEGIITRCNHGTAMLYGYACEELKGKHISITIPENYLADALKLIEAVKNGSRIDHYETQRLKKDGTLIDVSLSISPIISDGTISGISLIGRNISAQKNIENQLKESEERFRQIIQSAPDAVITFDSKQNITNWNSKAEEIFGWKKEEILNKKLRDTLIPKRYIAQFDRNYKKFMTGDGPLAHTPVKLTLVKKDNTEVSSEMSASISRINHEFTCVAFLRDITERTKAERDMQTNSALLKEAQQMTQMGSWEWDIEKDILKWSDELFRIFGCKPKKEGIYLKAYYSQIHPEDKEKVKRILQEALENPDDFKFEHRIIRKDNTVRYLSCKGKIIMEGNKSVKMFGTAQDVTDRKRTEEKLENYARELQFISRQKDKFFSIMAHDLRTPFQGLMGYSEIIENNFNELSKREITNYASKINQNAKRLLNLMNNLLDWSMLQTGKTKMNPEKVDICDLISDVMNILESAAANKKIKIESKIPKNCMAYGDLTMLRSCVQNLISNSIKFTWENGKIIVSVKPLTDALEVCIADNGIGMKPETIKKLFKIDEKISTPGTKKEKGTGLGLILVKEQIEKNGGIIWVESEPNKGSKFYFTIPAYSAKKDKKSHIK